MQWTHVREMKRFDQVYEQYERANYREGDRISTAVSYLNNEKLIDSKTSDKLLSLKDKMYEIRRKYGAELRQKKLNEMKASTLRWDAGSSCLEVYFRRD